MNVVERTHTVFTGQGQPDRVPVHSWLGLQFIRRLVPRHIKMIDLLHMWIDDPVNTIIKYQLDLGLDPIITTYSQHIGEHEVWPRMLFSYPDDAYANWQEDITVLDHSANSRTIQHRIHTPSGTARYSYRIENYSSWILEHFIKRESDLEMLQYRPNPEWLNLDTFCSMIAKADNQAWWLHHAPGPWDEAVRLRGFTALSMDILDRPSFVHRLMRIATDHLIKLYQRLGETGLHSVSMNETWVGVGLSPEVYRQFIQPYEIECVAAAHQAGLLVSYHNCGRGADFLDDMVATGADALETITNARNMGDFDLAEVKQHVKNRICLFGGFDERTLTSDDPEKVRTEVKRCIDVAAADGRYILRPSGQIFHADLRNIEIMCQTAHEYGRYA